MIRLQLCHFKKLMLLFILILIFIIYNYDNFIEYIGRYYMSGEITNNPTSETLEKLVQDEFNTNVAFKVYLKSYNDNVRAELKERIREVFFFSKGVHWKFDSFGIEKAGSRGTGILGYFIFRTTNVEKLKKLFLDEFKNYDNAIKISCSVAKYQKTEEIFFELDV